jgi:alpha-amylase/alpha-mannosidase (GH57 family)
MARIKLCFLWHMHQPFYRDLVSGEYRLPWVRLHALKDYFGMVKILDEFPKIRQTFNLAPSLLVQLGEYASGKAKDRFLDVVLKDAETLSAQEKEFLLSFSFRANEERVIQRFPRYAELLERMRQNAEIPGWAIGAFTTPMLRDLQVLTQLAWFDEEYLTKDDGVRALKDKGRDFTLANQELIGRKEKELLGKVLEAYRQAAERGQIEVSTSPFYHPILPLLCDSNIAHVSHPYVALPAQFAYPGDAAAQMTEARNYLERNLGIGVSGLWPPEGAVSDDVLGIAAEAGFRWTATDDGVLERTIGRELTAEERYRPYLWQRGQQRIQVLFRDRRRCELIGVVYARMEAEKAAEHFVTELHKACAGLLQSGQDAIVPIILDGENAWELYVENGRPFLQALYKRISEDPTIDAVTVTEALEGTAPARLERIYPGSWIDGNFDIWIGAEEDNHAWDLLLRARRRFDDVTGSTEENRRLAWEELMIAEGSDWCWWYGPEHSAEGRGEFDRLFRDHLVNVYRLLGDRAPVELGYTLLKPQEPEHRAPGGMIQPVIDGKQTSHAEWANAGRYRAAHTSGPIHRQRPPIQEVRYGSDGQNLYLWLGCGDATEVTIHIRNSAGASFIIDLPLAKQQPVPIRSALPPGAVEAAILDVCEMRISMAALQAKAGSQLYLKIDVWRDGLPMGSLPGYGELELKQSAMAAYTF